MAACALEIFFCDCAPTTNHAFLVSSGGKVAVKAADGGGESRIDVTGGEARWAESQLSSQIRRGFIGPSKPDIIKLEKFAWAGANRMDWAQWNTLSGSSLLIESLSELRFASHGLFENFIIFLQYNEIIIFLRLLFWFKRFRRIQKYFLTFSKDQYKWNIIVIGYIKAYYQFYIYKVCAF